MAFLDSNYRRPRGRSSFFQESVNFVQTKSAQINKSLNANPREAAGFGYLIYSSRVFSLYYWADGPPTSSDMLTHASAVLVGLVAVLWFFNDPDAPLAGLKGKRVLITGASSGIGEQLAYRFAKHGSQVTVTARRMEALEEVVQECSRLCSCNDTKHFAIAEDMIKLSRTGHLVREAISKMGGLDILVLNHILPHPILPFTPGKADFELLSRLFTINFKSYIHLAAHSLPYLKSTGGRIVVMNSAMGKISHPFLASYVASKHALDGFFSSWRSQFRYYDVDIGVTSCFLGYIGTASAIQGLRAARQTRLQQWITPAHPADTARAIALAVANEQDELYFPWSLKPLVLLYNLWPSLVDKLMRFMARTD